MKPAVRIALIFVLFMGLISTLGLWVLPHSFDSQNVERRLEGPSWTHWMGTDTLGRDQTSRILLGSRISLALGLACTGLAWIVGVTIGGLAGMFAKQAPWVDRFLMRIVDFFYIFPTLLVAILVGVFIGQGFWGIAISITLSSWVTFARLTRALVLQNQGLTYVENARAVGNTETRIFLKHILPNILGPLTVTVTLQIPHSILTETFLSFIGLGIQPPYASWGTLANEGFRAMQSFPHLILFPSFFLIATLVAFNILGDGQRHKIDRLLKK